ncbi:MAG: thioredoxin family protein [Hyphomicrobium sp.]|nr:thioredoxin family protein [Hyphomicrobium sp.]
MLKSIVTALAVLAFSTGMALASEFTKFDPATFAEAQKSGKSIVIHVHADWCPTCKAQVGPLKTLAASPDFKNVVAMTIDYDGQAEARKMLNITKQSTIIAFKGSTETARATGVTNAEAIEKLARSAL